MSAGVKVGLGCKLYYNAGTFGSPTWTLINITQDLDLNLEKGKAESKRRGNTWTKTLPVTKTGPVEFKILADTSDPTYQVLRDAFLNDTVLDVAIAEGPIATSGTEYERGDYYCYSFKRHEPLEQAASVDVALDLAEGTGRDPSFTTVGS